MIAYEDDSIERYMKFYHLVSWGVAGAIVAVLVASRHVWFDSLNSNDNNGGGDDDDICNDKHLSEYGLVRFLFFIPLVFSWLYSIFPYFHFSFLLLCSLFISILFCILF